jgi:hypothetical protein
VRFKNSFFASNKFAGKAEKKEILWEQKLRRAARK